MTKALLLSRQTTSIVHTWRRRWLYAAARALFSCSLRFFDNLFISLQVSQDAFRNCGCRRGCVLLSFPAAASAPWFVLTLSLSFCLLHCIAGTISLVTTMAQQLCGINSHSTFISCTLVVLRFLSIEFYYCVVTCIGYHLSLPRHLLPTPSWYHIMPSILSLLTTI